MIIQEALSNQLISRLDNLLLLAYTLKKTKAQILAYPEYELTWQELKLYQAFLARRLRAEPIAYILRFKEFYSREFKVTQATLIPRPETELLVEETLRLLKPGSKVLDLGTGSGCVAITLKLEAPKIFVYAVDNNPETLKIAKENATHLGAEVEFKLSNWYSHLSQKFDFIVSNPPYIARADEHLTNLKFEPINALTDFNNGLDCITEIITKAKYYLNKNAWVLLEHGYDQANAVYNLFKQNGFSQIQTKQDLSSNPRLTMANYN